MVQLTDAIEVNGRQYQVTRMVVDDVMRVLKPFENTAVPVPALHNSTIERLGQDIDDLKAQVNKLAEENDFLSSQNHDLDTSVKAMDAEKFALQDQVIALQDENKGLKELLENNAPPA